MLIDRLRDLRSNQLDGRFEPLPVAMTPAAKRLWIRFYNEHGREQSVLSGDLAAAWSKLEGYAARLALVLHFIRWAAEDDALTGADRLDEVSMAAGVKLARWFGHEARRVYAMLRESEEDRDQRRLVESIEARGGSVTPRELMLAQRSRYPRADFARDALGRLVESGRGIWECPPPARMAAVRLSGSACCPQSQNTEPHSMASRPGVLCSVITALRPRPPTFLVHQEILIDRVERWAEYLAA